MRFLAETNCTDEVFEIDTAHDEFTPQALRTALITVDKTAYEFYIIVSAMMGGIRCILVIINRLG